MGLAVAPEPTCSFTFNRENRLSGWVVLLMGACRRGSEHLGSGTVCDPQTAAAEAEVRVT